MVLTFVSFLHGNEVQVKNKLFQYDMLIIILMTIMVLIPCLRLLLVTCSRRRGRFFFSLLNVLLVFCSSFPFSSEVLDIGYG